MKYLSIFDDENIEGQIDNPSVYSTEATRALARKSNIYSGTPSTGQLGGIPAGTDLNGKTWQEIIQEATAQVIPATINITVAANSQYEEGITISGIQITASVTKGTTDIISAIIAKNGIPIKTVTKDEIINNTITAISEPISKTAVYSCTITDGSGTYKGNDVTVQFDKPVFYGVIKNEFESLLKLNKKLLPSLPIRIDNISCSQAKLAIAYPASWGALTKIDCIGGNNSIGAFTRSKTSYNRVEYYLYLMNYPTSVTNFSMEAL